MRGFDASDTSAVSTGPEVEIVIEAGLHDVHYWRDLWNSRELLAVIVWRDVLVRYGANGARLAGTARLSPGACSGQ